MIVGLTGGIGSGKSTVAKMFTALGVPVYNSDVEAKKLMRTPELRKKIIALLGKSAYKGKYVNRPFIAKKVFRDPALLQQLTGIVHPSVKNHFLEWTQRQNTPYVIQEVAILFENKSEARYDCIILVTAPKEERIKRVLQRDNTTRDKVLARMAHQWSDSKKRKKSHFIIYNTDLQKTKKKVAKIHLQLLNKGA